MIIAATINLAAATTLYQLYERLQSAGALRTDNSALQLQDVRFHILKMRIAPAAAAGTKARVASDGPGAVDVTGPSANVGYEFGNEAAGGTGAAATPVVPTTFEIRSDGNTISLKEIYLVTGGTNVEVQVWAMSI
jgi:hypothetical protein